MPPYIRDYSLSDKEGWQNILLGCTIIFIIFSIGLVMVVLGSVLDIQDLAIVGGLFLGFGFLVILMTVLFQVVTRYSHAKVGVLHQKQPLDTTEDVDYKQKSSTANLNPRIFDASPTGSQLSVGRQAESVSKNASTTNRTRLTSGGNSAIVERQASTVNINAPKGNRTRLISGTSSPGGSQLSVGRQDESVNIKPPKGNRTILTSTTSSPSGSQVSVGRHVDSVSINVSKGDRTRLTSATSSTGSTSKQLSFY